VSTIVIFLVRKCEPKFGSGVPCTAISGRTVIVRLFELIFNVFKRNSGKWDVGGASCLDGIRDQLGPNGSSSSSIIGFLKVLDI
jgi:hypothetical protein